MLKNMPVAILFFLSICFSEGKADEEPLIISTFLNVTLDDGIKKENSDQHFTEVILLEMFDRAGLPKPIIKDFNFNRAVEMAKSGRVDAVFPIMETPERVESLFYLSLPIEIANLYLFTLKSSSIPEYNGDLNSLLDLQLGYVGVGNYGTVGPFLRKDHGNTSKIPSVERLPFLLSKKRIDGFVITDYEGLEAIEKLNMRPLVKRHKRPIGQLLSTLAFTKQKEFNPKLIEKLNAALKDMHEDGTFEELSRSLK